MAVDIAPVKISIQDLVFGDDDKNILVSLELTFRQAVPRILCFKGLGDLFRST